MTIDAHDLHARLSVQEDRLEALERQVGELIRDRERKSWRALGFREKAKVIREWAHTIGVIFAVVAGAAALVRMPSKEALDLLEKVTVSDLASKERTMPLEQESAARMAAMAPPRVQLTAPAESKAAR